EKQKGSRGIRRGQWYRLVFQFPIREPHYAGCWNDKYFYVIVIWGANLMCGDCEVYLIIEGI
ncbi:hypothetical protein, partial [Escherichia coli]|uniref:hypothetical protein n=1 Tax=Escherichia coli TaxID=562 RepID=UPI001E512BC4